MTSSTDVATPAQDMSARLDALYRTESRRILATLIRLLKDFDLAEEALHEAFTAALAQWPGEGMPDNPCAWLVSAGRFRAIDLLRKRARFNTALEDVADELVATTPDPADLDSIDDDRLHELGYG